MKCKQIWVLPVLLTVLGVVYPVYGQDLSGTFMQKSGETEILLTMQDQIYRVSMNGNMLVSGEYTVSGDTMTVVDREGEIACPPDVEGTYTWKLESDNLTFTGMLDKCEGRKAALTAGVWARMEKTKIKNNR